ncbi:DUF2384 domain-containing protein [Pseudomonas sp. 57B-090624]|uniref:antitoxin Xre/MbcA/ParS toxin-binding domain-containing protein n=1 Tax=Pseudomonas sp. 57B-090624 TaxID=2213080 RepID=UPI000DA826A7|nr:antitoxin Xre/MbcA/ParS toxin-binding domain-containing protein [Pseudomonas sp. 57B-090624]PZE11150.1 DUF2384 domain-containing protein [Pseudomonas sp. 57B-090624]
MDKLHDKLDLPKGHYHLHQAILAGLPASLIFDLAVELGQPAAQIAEWIGARSMSLDSMMPISSSEAFCRLVRALDSLGDLYESNLEGAISWLTTPNKVLAKERPVDLLATEAGGHAVQQAIHAIEHGLPV